MSTDLKQAFDRVIKEMGMEIPKALDNNSHRDVYIRYLARKQLEESDVSPILAKEKVKPEAHAQLFLAFINAAKQNDKKALAATIDLMQTIQFGHNVNHLISRMARKLKDDTAACGVRIPEFFAGVYPTQSINAHCVVEDGIPLALIDTGCFEMVEVAVGTLMSKRDETEQAEVMIRALDDYFVKGLVPNPEMANHHSIEWGSGVVPALTTAVEEFILAHELGHLAQGHLEQGERHALPLRDGTVLPVQRRDHLQEYHADIWALQQLTTRARQATNIMPDDDTPLVLACAGPLIFLNIGLMIDAIAQSRKVPVGDTHPPIEDRLYLMSLTCEVLGLHDKTYVGNVFHKIVREFCVLLDVDERVPPLLSRDLNRVAVQVYDDLGIDYSHAKYVYDFT